MVEFATKSLNALCHLNVLRYNYYSNAGFYNPPLTKIDVCFLKRNCLYLLYLSASHRNLAWACSSKKGHIQVPVLGKMRKDPLLISSLLHGSKMVISSFRLKPCGKSE